jgi:hypothetical protein
MLVHFKSIFLPVSAMAIIGILAGNIAAQSTGPAAFAAKQDLKNRVLAAMSDGKISSAERTEILSSAKDILSAKEYVGLVTTMNRLSPPDKSVPQDIGYRAKPVDKQMMANFFAPSIPWLDKSPNLAEALSERPILSEFIPKQSTVVVKTAPKQQQQRTYVVKEIITKQTIVSAVPAGQTEPELSAVKQAVALAPAPKQKVAKAAAKQPAAKTAKSAPAAKAANVAIIPPPPPLAEEEKKPLAATSRSNVQKPAKPAKPADPLAPLPPAEQQTTNSSGEKPAHQKLSEGPKKQPAVDQVTIRQPASLLNVAEKSAATHFYADYSVPVLTTPAAALLSDRTTNTIQASFDEPLEPEAGPGIMRR